jgi:hypothetical protein
VQQQRQQQQQQQQPQQPVPIRAPPRQAPFAPPVPAGHSPTQGQQQPGPLPPQRQHTGDTLVDVIRMLTAVASAPSAGDYDVTLAGTPAPPPAGEGTLAALSFLMSTPADKLMSVLSNLSTAAREDLMGAVAALAQDTASTLPRLSLQAVLLQWIMAAAGPALSQHAGQAVKNSRDGLDMLQRALQPAAVAPVPPTLPAPPVAAPCPKAPKWPVVIAACIAGVAVIIAIVMGVLYHKAHAGDAMGFRATAMYSSSSPGAPTGRGATSLGGRWGPPPAASGTPALTTAAGPAFPPLV